MFSRLFFTASILFVFAACVAIGGDAIGGDDSPLSEETKQELKELDRAKVVVALLALKADIEANEQTSEVSRIDFSRRKIENKHLKILDALAKHQKPGVLTHLEIDRTPITDDGLKHLKQIKELDSLDLEFTAITDAGLSHISHMTSLKKLDLEGTKITDAGLKHLRKMKKLTALDLRNTDVSRTAADKLRKALSDVRTRVGPNPRDGDAENPFTVKRSTSPEIDRSKRKAKENHRILSLHRKYKSGQRFQFKGRGGWASTITFKTMVKGKSVEQEDKAVAEIHGELQILKVDKTGAATEVNLTIHRFQWDGKQIKRSDQKSAASFQLKKGDVLTAGIQKDDIKYAVKGRDGELPKALQTILDVLLPIDDLLEKDKFGTELFGLHQRRVGEIWKIDPRPKAFHGTAGNSRFQKATAKFVGVENVQKQKTAHVRIDLQATPPEDSKIKGGEVNLRADLYVLPASRLPPLRVKGEMTGRKAVASQAIDSVEFALRYRRELKPLD